MTAIGPWSEVLGTLASVAAAPLARTDAAQAAGRGGWTWLADPRSAVLICLGSVILIGGGRRLWQGWQARRAAERLADPDVTPAEVEAAADHGRAGLMELFRILGEAERPAPLRDAAGRALAALWRRDDLIAEEEQALVRRGFSVDWRARRRYPRGLRAPIPIEVRYGVPFLVDGGKGVGPADLEWSHRILGAERAGLERDSPWTAGPGLAAFAVDPGDFAGNGPHRLVLQAKVRTGKGLTGPWEIELPRVPFTFEFDPALAVDALAALEDSGRAEAIAKAVGLERPEPPEEGVGSTYLDLNDELALRDPPAIRVATPLPADLAHRVELEFEGVPGRFPAGAVVLSGQGTGRDEPEGVARFPLGPVEPLPPGAIERPGERSVRAILTADPDRGWADPAIRSIWPGTITTDWTPARVVRR